jgi:hypothetical protein
MTLREFHVLGAIVAAALLSVVVLGPAAGEPAPRTGLRLIMVEAPHCQFCMRWHAEVGSSYQDRPEGRAAPLVRLMRDAPELAGFKPAVYTPTFILAREGREIGRIPGYPGEAYFWSELSELFKSAGIGAPPEPAQGESR